MLAALCPQRVSSIAALALGYQPFGILMAPGFVQSRCFWYQWLKCVDGGADVVRRDPVGFARIQWETWSPPGWFDMEEFAATTGRVNNPRSRSNPPMVSMTLAGKGNDRAGAVPPLGMIGPGKANHLAVPNWTNKKAATIRRILRKYGAHERQRASRVEPFTNTLRLM